MKAREPYRFEISAWASGLMRQLARSASKNYHRAARAIGVPRRIQTRVVAQAKYL